jgi:hypothetical protein
MVTPRRESCNFLPQLSSHPPPSDCQIPSATVASAEHTEGGRRGRRLQAADPHYPVRHAPLCRAYHPGRVTATLDGGLTLPGSTVPAKACTGDNCCARGQTQATAQPWPPGGALHT